MTSRNVLAIVFLAVLAFSSVGCPNKQKDGGASAEGSAAPAAQAPKAGEKEDDKDDDDDEDEEKDGKGDKKDEGGW